MPDDAKMKESFAGDYGGKSGGAHGPGGLKAANKRSANKHAELNMTPGGPYSHMLGYTGDGGMYGETSAEGKNGATFWFK